MNNMPDLLPSRTNSHFVELNSHNEDMLLEEIDANENNLNKMLLDEEEPCFERSGDDGDLLI